MEKVAQLEYLSICLVFGSVFRILQHRLRIISCWLADTSGGLTKLPEDACRYTGDVKQMRIRGRMEYRRDTF